MTQTLELKATGECPICDQKNPEKELFSLDRFSVFACPSCGMKYIDPSLTADQQMEMYQNSEMLAQINPALENYYEYETLNEKSLTYKDYVRALEACESAVEGRSLCEIGCGEGSFLKLAKSKGWDVVGLDSSRENMEALEKDGIQVICGDAFKEEVEGRFDVVVLWDIIEHPQKPRELLTVAKKLLRPGGVVLIATPCYPNLLSVLAGFFYSLGIKGPAHKMYMLEHTTYFSPDLLRDLVLAQNFSVFKWWKTETDLDRYYFPPLTKLILRLSFLVAKVFRLQNRLMMIAKRDGP